MRGPQPERLEAEKTASHRERGQSGIKAYLGRDWPWIFAVLLVAFAAAWPAISQPGLLNTRGGGDSPFLLQRLQQLVTALGDGHFPVRWMPDANYGYGYPFYNYYAPLSIYIAAFFRFLGFSVVRAIHLAHLAGFAVAALGMFHLGRRWLGSRGAGLLAAVAYTTAPFHMVNVYVRGDSLAEFWAMAFYPLILLAADRLVEATASHGRPAADDRPQTTDHGHRSPSVVRRLALFAVAYAALILSHNISALIFSPFLLLFFITRLMAVRLNSPAPSDDSALASRPSSIALSLAFRGLGAAAGGLLLAFALAAWFFVPALAEQGLAQLGPVTAGYFHYINHFRGLDLIQGSLLFDYNPDGGAAFRLGLVQVGLAIAGAVVWWLAKTGSPVATGYSENGEAGEKGRKGPGRQPDSSFAIRHSAFVVVSALIAVFMITPLSRPLWDTLPLLPFTQFPWRFLSVASFFLALLAGGLVLVADRPAARATIALAGSLILLAAGVLGLRVDHLILTDADVTGERLAQYEWFTGNIGTTVSAEYLTPESSPRPWTSAWLNTDDRDLVIATTGQITAQLVDRTAVAQTWRITAGPGGADALLPTMFWPGWRATIDGRSADLRAFPSSGLMTLNVPAGDHTVRLELGRTPVRLAAELVSAAAAIVTLALMIGRHWTAAGRSHKGVSPGMSSLAETNSHHTAPLLPFLRGLLFVAAFLLLAAVLWRGDPKALPGGDQTWDFAQMGYLHHSPGGISFTNGARLYEYGYSTDTVVAGQTLTVTLSIAPGNTNTATLALVSPASARPTPDGAANPPQFVAQTVTLAGEAAVFTLPISPVTPAGLFVPRLVLEGAEPLMPSGGTRGDLFLRPIRVVESMREDEAGSREEDMGGGKGINVRAETLSMRDATTLEGRFAWSTTLNTGGRYQVSWRLQNGDGLVLSQLDSQPGYGFNPTGLWPAGEMTHDWLALRLPESLAGPPPYALVMLLYDATTGEQLLIRRVGEIEQENGRLTPLAVERVFEPPATVQMAGVTFAEDRNEFIRLYGYEIEQSSAALAITLYWQALNEIPADFTRFVHLLDATGSVAGQVDGHPAGNSYPTGQWVEGEVIEDVIRFDPAALPPGEYRVAVGFYRPVEGLPRLEAAMPEGHLPDGRFLLPGTVAVPAP